MVCAIIFLAAIKCNISKYSAKMRNLKSSSTVELVITSHLAFDLKINQQSDGHCYIATAYISAEMLFILFNGAM